jgi:hypothetical protein
VVVPFCSVLCQLPISNVRGNTLPAITFIDYSGLWRRDLDRARALFRSYKIIDKIDVAVLPFFFVTIAFPTEGSGAYAAGKH